MRAPRTWRPPQKQKGRIPVPLAWPGQLLPQPVAATYPGGLWQGLLSHCHM